MYTITLTKEQFDELFQLKYKTVPVQLQSEFEEEIQKGDTSDDFDCAMNTIENTSFEIYWGIILESRAKVLLSLLYYYLCIYQQINHKTKYEYERNYSKRKKVRNSIS